jgi:hypothetical protein
MTKARMGEALFGGPTRNYQLRRSAFRERSRTHAWAKPCLAAKTYTPLAPLATSRERSRTHAWAKPCLAGRPTALVRTQCCETNTSRGRPSGMELPDYPVVATPPTPWDQDGPALPLPAGSFPVLVTRYASRRVFSQIRNSLRFPPGLFSNSYLVMAPAGFDLLLRTR